MDIPAPDRPGHAGTDVAVAAVVLAATLLATVAAPPGGGLTVPAAITAVVACGTLALRRRHPFAVLAVSSIAAEAYLVHYSGHQGTMIVAAPLVALYTVADISPRRHALVIGVLVLLAFGGLHVVVKPASWLGADNLALAAFGGLAIAAGVASRNRRAYLAEAQARAAQAEAERDAEAARRVSDERLRIARDLHDVIGHQLALISVQSRVAAHLLDAEPEQARQALAHVQEASRAALGDLSGTIGLLRRPGESIGVTEPAAGLAAIEDLLAAFRRSGLTIRLDIDGPVPVLPLSSDLAAYRILQESLTNVCKHAGPTTVRVWLAYRADALHIEVENGPTARIPEAAGPGHGLVGMRERATALGGGLTAGPRPDGGYRVSAVFPLGGGDA